MKWSDVGKVALAAALASITLATSFWTSTMGLFGVVAAGCCFMAVYVPLLLLLRVPGRCSSRSVFNSLWVRL